MDKIRDYVMALFSNVIVYVLVDVLFATFSTFLLAGVFYLSSMVFGVRLPFGRDEILLAAQVLFAIYLLVIIYTSIGQFIKFKKHILTMPENPKPDE